MHKIQRDLLEISPRASKIREDAAILGQVIQVAGSVGQVGSALFALIGILALGNYPNAGISAAVTGICGVIGSREVYLFGKNLEKVMTSNYFERALICATGENFTCALTKDTLVLHHFSKIFAQVLERSGPY